MLIQLHHQWIKNCKTIKTEICAQRDISENNHIIEMRAFIKETKESHPLPEDAQWLVCPEKSKYFVMTHKEAP